MNLYRQTFARRRKRFINNIEPNDTATRIPIFLRITSYVKNELNRKIILFKIRVVDVLTSSLNLRRDVGLDIRPQSINNGVRVNEVYA